VPLRRAIAYAAYVLWISVCTSAPEFIWQGFTLMRGHLGPAELWSALFIGALFACFVEPLVERLKAGRWQLEHESPRGLLLSTLLSVGFGVLVVFIHEAISAFFAAGHSGDEGKQAVLAEALEQVIEWACVPAVATLCWFAARASRRLALPSAVVACLAIVALGFLYDWGVRMVVSTSVPSCFIAVLGTRLVMRRWDAGTFPALAKMTASVAAIWLILNGVAEAAAHAGLMSFELYAPGDFYVDLRFYLGWALGLGISPSPVDQH
jgi:hypothetical protein